VSNVIEILISGRTICFTYLLCLDGSQQVCVQYWQLVDKIIQQVALQTKEGSKTCNPDVAPLDVDIKKLLKQCVLFR